MARSPKIYRVVIDTNVFVSGVLVKQGNPNRLLRSWQQGQIQLIAPPGLIAEVDRTLHRARIKRKYQVPEDEIQELLANLREAEEGVPQEDMPITSRDIRTIPFLPSL